jgi:hypothetical protein
LRVRDGTPLSYQASWVGEEPGDIARYSVPKQLGFARIRSLDIKGKCLEPIFSFPDIIEFRHYRIMIQTARSNAQGLLLLLRKRFDDAYSVQCPLS